jgi:hypothetical protein
VADHSHARVQIDFQISNLQDGRVRRRIVASCASENGFNTRDQFGRAEGLRDVIVRAHLKGSDLVNIGAQGGNDDDGQIAALAQ